MFQKSQISYFPLYILLMITMLYYCFKYLHEWYHYFSISAEKIPIASKFYTVDILTTYCAGEPFDMLEQTLSAIQNIPYPHTAWCCDEADDAEVKKLCLQLGVRHITRYIKNDAKAGNINNALQYATGELCVILDPDHIPSPDFLDHVVAYFDDPAIGFVQVVQAYHNQKESLVAKGAAQQTYQFYGPMMMSMNSYGTVQAIGANCTFRRQALDSIGGHASGLAEDMHTAMQLHAKGWRSLYVPSILTRGLVPATMSSYFKQQLKWSRGTWELLLTIYPRLFSKFTLRQKIHYGTLPFHYLSGFVFLINFLIPVISLFTGFIPLQMDVVNFLLAALPLFSMGVLIRHFVQKWVAETEERGFHIVGGILQIGTWWIHSIGFIYTLLRKKVPYLPTPKNDHDPLPLLLSLPNIIVAVVSLAAIIYGLWHDYNPYTIFMVLLAFMQILFMAFILSVSGYTSDTSRLNRLFVKLREHTWLIIKTHGFLRTYSLPLAFLVLVFFVFGYWQQQQLPDFLARPLPGLNVFYRGLHLQSDTNINRLNDSVFTTSIMQKDIAIISFEVPWGKGEKNSLDTDYINQVYNLHALPLLAFSLWQNDSVNHIAKDPDVMNRIIAGKYDEQLRSFAIQVAHLNKPVYISCNTVVAQYKYPLFAQALYKPENYIAAWKYVHDLFDEVGADKVIWIWTPVDSLNASQYYPGNDYVDWLGLDITNLNTDKFTVNSNSFDSLYRPFHRLPLFKSGLPVIITATFPFTKTKEEWWNNAWKNIDTAFTEIKSVVVNGENDAVNKKWATYTGLPSVELILAKAPKSVRPFEMENIGRQSAMRLAKKIALPDATKSVVYDKGVYWFQNRHTLNLKIVQADIVAMKKMGINAVERTMPGFYDDNLGRVLEDNGMHLIPRFWLLGSPDEIADDKKMKQQKEEILKTIKKNLNKKYIIAWNLGEDVLYRLSNQIFKPDYFYYRQKYIAWLSDLCHQIRLLDSVRPLVMDLHWDINGEKQFHYYQTHVPEIDTYMLEADVKYPMGFKKQLKNGMAWSKVPVESWPLLPSIRQSGTIPAWQDVENTAYIALNGLLDLQGRKTQWYGKVDSTWGNNTIVQSSIPEVKILKPARVTHENAVLTYHLLYKKEDEQWRLFDGEEKKIRFEWYLVRIDQYGNNMYIKKIGEGHFFDLKIPKEPQYYKLYVEAISGEDVKVMTSALNTSLE
jgi:cellulose synthase/poly-beta-1,6-N-acetylglucosamine synthase-like glycosyltransferase